MSVTSTVAGGPKGKFLLCEVDVARSSDMGTPVLRCGVVTPVCTLPAHTHDLVHLLRAPGVNDKTFTVKCHLGNILKAGDAVMGYDLTGCAFNNADLNGTTMDELPELVLVRKCYPRRRAKRLPRPWQLKRLNAQIAGRSHRCPVSRGDVFAAVEPIAHVPCGGSASYSPTEGEVERKDEVAKLARDIEMFMQDVEEDKFLRNTVPMYKGACARRHRVRVVPDRVNVHRQQHLTLAPLTSPTLPCRPAKHCCLETASGCCHSWPPRWRRCWGRFRCRGWGRGWGGGWRCR